MGSSVRGGSAGQYAANVSGHSVGCCRRRDASSSVPFVLLLPAPIAPPIPPPPTPCSSPLEGVKPTAIGVDVAEEPLPLADRSIHSGSAAALVLPQTPHRIAATKRAPRRFAADGVENSETPGAGAAGAYSSAEWLGGVAVLRCRSAWPHRSTSARAAATAAADLPLASLRWAIWIARPIVASAKGWAYVGPMLLAVLRV